MPMFDPRDPNPRPRKSRNRTDYRPSRQAGPAKRKPKKDDMQIPDWVTKFGKIAVDPLAGPRKAGLKKIKNKLAEKQGPSAASKAADSGRKTKQGQAIAMGKVKTQKSVAAQGKRATGAAIKAATKKKIDNKRKTGFYEKPKGK
jgi:hypothetical protein